MSRQNLSRADTLYKGRAAHPLDGKPGVSVVVPIIKNYGAIATAVATAAAASQSVGAGASFILNGTLASGGVVTNTVPRNIVAAWTTSSTLTFTGTDENGKAIREVSAAGTSHAGKKAFKTITGITSSASITLATVGNGDVIGLPARSDAGEKCVVLLNGVSIDAATLVRADTTSPATGLTGDVRGTFDPSAAINATNIFTVEMVPHDDTTVTGCFGVTQFSG